MMSYLTLLIHFTFSLFFQTSHNNSLSILDILSKNQLLIIFIFCFVSLSHFTDFFFFLLIISSVWITFLWLFTCRSYKTSKLVMRNHTVITTFILLGFTEDPQLLVLIFVFLFLTYVMSVTGNLTIIILTFMDSHLKTHVFFLQKLCLLRNLIFNGVYSQIPVQNIKWGQ